MEMQMQEKINTEKRHESPMTQKYSNLNKTTTETLKYYMEKLTVEVERQISSELPQNLSLVLDGGTSVSTHFHGHQWAMKLPSEQKNILTP